jgi:hypothetical protein
MATEFDPNERLPKANPTRWLPWVLLVVLAILIFALIRSGLFFNSEGGNRVPDSRGSKNVTTTPGREATGEEVNEDSVATDSAGSQR